MEMKMEREMVMVMEMNIANQTIKYQHKSDNQAQWLIDDIFTIFGISN